MNDPITYYSRTFDVLVWNESEDEPQDQFIVHATFRTYTDARAYIDECDVKCVAIRPPNDQLRASVAYLAAIAG